MPEVEHKTFQTSRRAWLAGSSSNVTASQVLGDGWSTLTPQQQAEELAAYREYGSGIDPVAQDWEAREYLAEFEGL